jgi:hypothetical protein
MSTHFPPVITAKPTSISPVLMMVHENSGLETLNGIDRCRPKQMPLIVAARGQPFVEPPSPANLAERPGIIC